MKMKKMLALLCLVLIVSTPLAIAESLDWNEAQEGEFDEQDSGAAISVQVRNYEPTILTSNLIADNDVRVYAFLAGTTIGTLFGFDEGTEPIYGGIEVEKVRVKPGNIETKEYVIGEPKYVKPLKQDMDTLGYLIITLKQIEEEEEIPEEVNLSFTAEIYFSEAERLFTLAQTYLVLPEDEDIEEWEEKLPSDGDIYSFFGGRGLLRAKNIQDSSVDLTVYSNKDLFWPITGAPRPIAEESLSVGETSNYYDLGDLEEATLRNAKFRIKLDSIDDPAREKARVHVNVDGRAYALPLTEGMSLFPGSTWTVKNIFESRGNSGTEYTLEIKDKKGNKKSIVTIAGFSAGGDELNKKFYSSGDAGDDVVIYASKDRVMDSVPVNELDALLSTYGVRVDVSGISTETDTTQKHTLQEGQTVKDVLVSILPTGYFYTYESDRILIESYGATDPCIDIGVYYVDELPTDFSDVKRDTIAKQQLICTAIQEYEYLADEYGEEQNEDRIYYVDIAEEQVGKLYEELASTYAGASEKRLANERALEYYKRIEARGQYDPSSISAKVVELTNEISGDFSYGEITIEDSGRYVYVKLLEIEQTADEDLTSAVISVEGKSETYLKDDFLFSSSIVDDDGYSLNWRIYAIDDDVVRFKREYTGSSAPSKSSGKPRNTIVEDEQGSISGYTIQVKNIDVKKEAHFTIIPGSGDSLKSESNFSIHIPVEKRAFDLNPEEIEAKIAKFKKLQEGLEKAVETLDKIVTTWTKVCYGVFAFVSLKSSFASASAQARSDAVNGFDGQGGWHAYCQEESSGPYSERPTGAKTYDECMLAHANEIESDIQAIESARSTGAYGDVSHLSSGFTNLEECEEYIGSAVFMDDATKEEWSMVSGSMPGLSTRMQEDSAEYLTTLESSYSSVPLQNRIDACNAASEAVETGGLSGDEKEKAFEAIYDAHTAGASSTLISVSRFDSVGLISNYEYHCGGSGSIAAVGRIYPGETTTGANKKIYNDQGQAVTVTRMDVSDLKVYLEAWNNDHSTACGLDSENQSRFADVQNRIVEDLESIQLHYKKSDAWFMGDELETTTGIMLYSSTDHKTIYVGAEAFSTQQTRDDFAEDAVIEIYGSGEYKGMPYCLPYDDGVFVKISEYSNINEPSKFSVWNVGSDGKLCTTDDVWVNHESELALNTELYSNYLSFINRYINKDFTTAECVPIEGRCFEVSTGKSQTVQEGSVASCYQVMNPSDCKLLFSVCDPVMCPPSRFNLQGRWNVDNVVETGLVGSLILGYGNGDPVPICLTGVLASLKFWEFQVEAVVDCLETAKYEGEYVGICDVIYSLYWCELITREAAAILGANGGLLDFVSGKLLGGGLENGGGEYFRFKENMENVKNSVTYFTTEYSNQAFAAFRGKSLKEIGSDICKQAIYAKTPWFGDFMDQITTPEDPSQFTAHMTVKPYSETLKQNSYQVFYHIYAGVNANIDRIVYSVYLKNSLTGATYPVTGECGGTGGTIEQGGMVDETIDCVYDSGYDEVCVIINGEEHCGFGKVSTSFALNYVEDMIIADEAKRNISSSQDCYPEASTMSPSLSKVGSFGMTDSAILPYSFGALETGIQRICSVDNPSKGQGTSGDWSEVGTCGYDSEGRFIGYCWVNRDSVSIKDAERNENVNTYLDDVSWDISRSSLGVDTYLDDANASAQQNKLTKTLKDLEAGGESVEGCKSLSELTRQWKDLSESALSFTYAASGQYGLAKSVALVDEVCGVEGRGLISYTLSAGGEDVTNDGTRFVAGAGDSYTFTFTDTLATDEVTLNGQPCTSGGNNDWTCVYSATGREETVKLLIKDRNGNELLSESFTFTTEEIDDNRFSNCGACGDGGGNICDDNECHSLGEGCYFDQGLGGTALSVFSKSEYGSCEYCSDANFCSDLDDDETMCESSYCTSKFGETCKYEGGECKEAGNSIVAGSLAELMEELKTTSLSYDNGGYSGSRRCYCDDNCEDYANEIVANAEKYNIDPLLILSVMMIESQCKQGSVSTSGCEGLMQICSESMCRSEVGFTESEWREVIGSEDLESAEKNIECGAIILDKYNSGDLAYGGGCNRAPMTYTGWEASLRRYNGVRCDTKYPQQDYYVEATLDVYEQLEDMYDPSISVGVDTSISSMAGMDILVFGDSITFHGGFNTGGNDFDGYVTLLNSKFRSEGVTFHNVGYSGDGSSKIASCLVYGYDHSGCDSADVAAATVNDFDIEDYDAVMILATRNDDLESDWIETKNNLATMYQYVQEEGMEVIAMTLLPCLDDGSCTNPCSEQTLDNIKELNEWIMTGADVDYYVDLYEPYETYSGSGIPKYHDGDCLHPEANGHELMADTIYDTLIDDLQGRTASLSGLSFGGDCIVLYGDSQSGDEEHANIATSIANEECSSYTLLHVGDFVSTGTNSDMWDDFIEESDDLFDQDVVMLPVVGNHEAIVGDSTSYGVYEVITELKGTFSYVEALLGKNDYGYYAEEISDNIFFIGLNNAMVYTLSSSSDICKEQADFLATELSGASGYSKIILSYHIPAYPIVTRYTSQNPCADSWHDILTTYSSRFDEIIVISGHTHGLAHAIWDGIDYLEVGASHDMSSEKHVDEVGETGCSTSRSYEFCEVTPGYWICDSNLDNCLAKDQNGNEIVGSAF